MDMLEEGILIILFLRSPLSLSLLLFYSFPASVCVNDPWRL